MRRLPNSLVPYARQLIVLMLLSMKRMEPSQRATQASLGWKLRGGDFSGGLVVRAVAGVAVRIQQETGREWRYLQPTR